MSKISCMCSSKLFGASPQKNQISLRIVLPARGYLCNQIVEVSFSTADNFLVHKIV